MGRRVAGFTLLTVCCLLLAGCWDYKGLNELTIITGIAVDIGEDGEGLELTFEYVDMTSESDSEYNSRLLITEGATMAEAVYDASTKLHNNMYLGNAEIVIISKQLAEEEGVHTVLDFLLRAYDTRDNLHIVVADTETAGELLTPDEDQENGILSFTLSETLEQHEGNTANSTNAVESYEIYNVLALGTSSLALPIVTSSEEDEHPFQFKGMALFTEDKMTGRLAEEDMSFYLLAVKALRGGGYPVEVVKEEDRSIVIANRKSVPSKSFTHDSDGLHFMVRIYMNADVIEISSGWDELTGTVVEEMEREISKEMSASVEKALTELRDGGYDVLGFSETLRNYNYSLWEAVQEDWDSWFANSDISVRVDVRIDNTGMIEHYGGGAQ